MLNIQHIFIHLLVAACFAAVAAACRNHNGTGDGMCCAVEVDGAALHMKSPVDMMAAAAERPCDLAGVGIDE